MGALTCPSLGPLKSTGMQRLSRDLSTTLTASQAERCFTGIRVEMESLACRSEPSCRVNKCSPSLLRRRPRSQGQAIDLYQVHVLFLKPQTKSDKPPKKEEKKNNKSSTYHCPLNNAGVRGTNPTHSWKSAYIFFFF